MELLTFDQVAQESAHMEYLRQVDMFKVAYHRVALHHDPTLGQIEELIKTLEEIKTAQDDFWENTEVKDLLAITSGLTLILHILNNHRVTQGNHRRYRLVDVMLWMYSRKRCPGALQAIWDAVRPDEHVLITRLVELGQDPNVSNRSPALLHSSELPDKTVRYLLEKGADPNILDEYGRSCLVVSREKTATLMTLIWAGASVNYWKNTLDRGLIYFLLTNRKNAKNCNQVMDEMLARTVDLPSKFPLTFGPETERDGPFMRTTLNEIRERRRIKLSKDSDHLKLQQSPVYNRLALVYVSRTLMRKRLVIGKLGKDREPGEEMKWAFPLNSDCIKHICQFVTSEPLGKLLDPQVIAGIRNEEFHWRLLRKHKHHPVEKKRILDELRNMIRLRLITVSKRHGKTYLPTEIHLLEQLKALAVKRRRNSLLLTPNDESDYNQQKKKYTMMMGSKEAVKLVLTDTVGAVDR